MEAARIGSPAVIRVLLRSKANLWAKDVAGRTAYDYFCERHTKNKVLWKEFGCPSCGKKDCPHISLGLQGQFPREYEECLELLTHGVLPPEDKAGVRCIGCRRG